MSPIHLYLTLSGISRAAGLEARCIRGCLPGGDETPALLYHAEGRDIELEWTSEEDPGEVLLLAGDPMDSEKLSERGVLTFSREDGLWRARVEVSAEELLGGTFVTALLAGEGRARRILHWRVWRPLTPPELARQAEAPQPWDGWELGLAPAMLRIETGGRSLPVGARAGKLDPWWAPPTGDPWTDLDLDGASNGAPGVGVAISPVWASRADDPGWMQEVARALGAGGRDVAFEDLAWTEVPARSVEAQLGQAVEIRAYYAAVTVHTQASGRAVDRDALRGWAWRCGEACFSHETSAVLKVPDELPLWSGYSPREHTQDPELLALMQRQMDEEGGVPGLDVIRRGDGDGGATRVDLGLVAAIQPWAGQEEESPRILGVDVVGSRAGIGEIQSDQRETLPTLPRLFAGIFGGGEAREVDLADLPEGWSAWGASARVLSQPGLLRPIDEVALAQKGLGSGVEIGGQRVVVSTELRAGALVRRGSFGRSDALVPVNAFAQVVLRVTVASPRALVVDVAPERLPGEESEGGKVDLPPAPAASPPLLERARRGMWVAAGLVGLGLVAYLAAQVRGVVVAVAKVLGRRRR